MEGRGHTSNMFWMGSQWELVDWVLKNEEESEKETGFSGSSYRVLGV